MSSLWRLRFLDCGNIIPNSTTVFTLPSCFVCFYALPSSCKGNGHWIIVPTLNPRRLIFRSLMIMYAQFQKGSRQEKKKLILFRKKIVFTEKNLTIDIWICFISFLIEKLLGKGRNICFCLSWYRVSFYSPGWPETQAGPELTAASQVLRLQVGASHCLNSVAVIKYLTKAIQGRKGLFWLPIPSYSSQSRAQRGQMRPYFNFFPFYAV